MDAVNGRELQPLGGHTADVVGVAFSPEGTLIASASHDQTARVWEVATGRLRWELKGHTHVVRSVAFSPDGTRIATGSGDQSVKVWDVATGRELQKLVSPTCWVHSVAFSPDGHRLALGSETGSPDEDERLRRGLRLALGSGDGTVQLWDPAIGRQEHSIQGHGYFVYSVAFSPDGTRLASASQERNVKVWDVAAGQEVLTLKGHTGGVNGVAFSPDGDWLASASADGTVKLWDARPVTPDGALEREALGLLAFLSAKPLSNAAVLDALRRWPIIRPEARQKALALAEHGRE